MKLTCVVIVAVLLLTACQLIIAEDSRGTQLHRALRKATKLSVSTRTCVMFGSMCDKEEHSICCYECDYKKGICV
uniref:Conotoxin Bu4 n=1 Tax=Conus bullatus TaxID=89438 RepID=O164_CONBU|nr:RecName: Full=Conotoxin Bu4; Flags: Precursor [Conus bullatus]